MDRMKTQLGLLTDEIKDLKEFTNNITQYTNEMVHSLPILLLTI